MFEWSMLLFFVSKIMSANIRISDKTDIQKLDTNLPLSLFPSSTLLA